MVHASKALTWLAAPHVGAHPLLDGCHQDHVLRPCQLQKFKVQSSFDALFGIYIRSRVNYRYSLQQICIHVYRKKRRNKRRVRKQEGIVRGKGKAGGR